ncbi:phosphohydrolase [Actinosynnema pretiosum subsp. pretiosum]|uniref:Phosphohydrolase n=1 Tax=Actinosynnema pretiosum subsp. pretiosum TaxID=103721 RepID=A0AA45R4H1_9PSEU|nr:phosphohydrolase [Actinosynnema pretiosum subsp. pretiosum]
MSVGRGRLPGGDRGAHVRGAARRASELAATVPENDRELLVRAAWPHDVGYAEPLRDSGFHPLDGARSLERDGWPRRLVGLVAHHSGASLVAGVLGLEDELARYPREDGPVADALTHADRTTGPTGRRVSVPDRLAEVLRRHGPGSPNALAHPVRAPRLLAIADRVERRLTRLEAVPATGKPGPDHW